MIYAVFSGRKQGKCKAAFRENYSWIRRKKYYEEYIDYWTWKIWEGILLYSLISLGMRLWRLIGMKKGWNKVLPFVTNAQIGDSTNAEFLRSLGIGNYDICFVTIGGDFQNSLETTSLLKELGAQLVISRAERDVQEKFLLRNGCR